MSSKTGAVETQRLFFALWPDAGLQHQFASVAQALLPTQSVRRVRPENLHCTLVFLGAVNAEQRLCLEQAANEVHVPRFTLVLDRSGYFRKPQVAWLGSSRLPVELLELVAGLTHAAEVCGFPPEQRPYAVHLTVARKVARDPGRLPFLPVSWTVQRFALVESVSTPDGMGYRPLCFWEL